MILNPEFFVEGYVDRSGHFELCSSDGFLYGPGNAEKYFREFVHMDRRRTIVTYDVRKLHHLGLEIGANTIDVRMLYAWDGELGRLAKAQKVTIWEELERIERSFGAHTTAVVQAQMNIEGVPLKRLIPDEIRREYMSARLQAIGELYHKAGYEEHEKYRGYTKIVSDDLLQIESSKIKVDVPYMEQMLKRKDLAVHETKFFADTLKNQKDGFVRTKISPVGARTWRLRVEGGFNCMAVPHGVCRKAIVSRWEGGVIATFDFNAIDYRCLVKAADDPKLNEFYNDTLANGFKKPCKDFHARTASIFGDVTPELRDQTKKMTYTGIYGGSMQTLQKQTMLPIQELHSRVARLEELFAPITEFRKQLSERARQDGYLINPGGQKVIVEKGDHDGKIVGLFGQSYSSHIFNESLHNILHVQRVKACQSKVIFPVHDELVVDLHPDEKDQSPGYIQQMERGTGFVVKSKTGKSYGEATDG